MRRGLYSWALLVPFLASFAVSETLLCDNPNVSVTFDQRDIAELTCNAVEQAEALFDRCDLPPLRRPLRIDIVDDLKPGCVALYHCGKDRIEVLEPQKMQARRSPKDAFAFLDITPYFQSVIVHELSHSNFDDAPCPFESCIAADEYIAYSMQIMSLTPEQKTEFVANSDLDRKITRDELSAIILFMAPTLFARKSWAHLSQRDDQCGYLRKILDGTILFDYERF
ncbi:hypothetical protein [Litoreibacter halocynthiae]|uniref:hypothetical protein n=1 Tax=Litoreibacter halocynthiae TaxID=1242689 RepID=UPI002490EA10|nr:hypothetical protein [Litoreibacter halocynthiae]